MATDSRKPRTPSTASGQREAARRHTHRAYSERNELLLVLTQLWESHTMPVSGTLKNLNRQVLCIHSPAGQIAYVLSEEEQPDFAHLPLSDDSHWDGCTRAERSERLRAIQLPGKTK